MEKQCRAVVAELRLPSRFSMRQLTEAVAARQGIPIRMQPLQAAAGPEISGAVAYRAGEFAVCYPTAAGRFFRRMVQTHELSHIACDHLGPRHIPDDDSEVADPGPSEVIARLKELMPALHKDIEEWGQLFRCQMSGQRELEAEFTGSLLYARLADRPDPITAVHGADPVRNNFAHLLGGHRRRGRDRDRPR